MKQTGHKILEMLEEIRMEMNKICHVDKNLGKISETQKKSSWKLRVKRRLISTKLELDNDKFGWFFLVVFIGVLVVLTSYFWTHFYQFIDDDIAGEHLYSKKVWNTGNPFYPGFANNNELLFSRPWLIFIMIYSFVKNAALATRIELIVAIWLVTCSAVFFFRKLTWNWPVVFLATVAFWGLMSPIRLSTQYNLTPFDVYTNFYIGFFITLGILKDVSEYRIRKRRLFKLILLYALAFYFGLCGVRMTIYLYVPLVAVMLLERISENLKGVDALAAQRNKLFHSTLILIANLAALTVNLTVLGQYMHAIKYAASFIPYGMIWDRVKSTCMYLLQALDIDFTGESVAALRSILTLYKIALLGVIIWAALFLRKRMFEEKETLAVLLLSIGILVFTFAFTTDSGFPGRFMTIPMVVALMVGVSYSFLRSHMDMRALCYGFCFFVVIGVCLTAKVAFQKMPMPSEAPSALMQLTEFLENTGRKRIAGHYWNISTPVLFSNGAITGMTLKEDDMLQPYDWITDRTIYANDDEPVTVVLTGEQKSAWEQSKKRAHLLSLANGVAEIAGYYLYDFDKNPFAFDLYSTADYGLDIRCNFLTLEYSEGATLDDGSIVLHQDEIQFGPYMSLKAGKYEITVRGDNLENGIFDVVSGGGTVKYELENLEISPNRVIYAINLTQDELDIEFRCINGSMETVKIRDITVTPRDMRPIWE